MNLIDCSYFYAGPLQIENAKPTDDLDNNAYAVQEAVTAYIERYQGEYLRKMVGESLAVTVEEYLAAVTENEERRDEPGWEPYVNDHAETLCAKLRLSFAHYVYYKIAGDVNQQMTITGLMLMKSANGAQPPRQRMVRVWNDMVELNRRFVAWAESAADYAVFYHVEMITPINQYNL